MINLIGGTRLFKKVVWRGKRGGLEIHYAPYLLLTALALFSAGLFMPYCFIPANNYVLRLIYQSIRQRDTGMLLESAILLTFVNVFRSMPNYLCVMVMINAITIFHKHKRLVFIVALISILPAIVILRLAYSMIDYVYSIEYGLGIHSLVIIMFILYIYSIGPDAIKPAMLVFIMTLYVTGIQFLDIIPVLTDFGMGKGELSAYVKMGSVLLECDRIITIFSATVFAVLIINSFIIVRLVLYEHRLVSANAKEKTMEKQIYVSRMQAMEMRSFQEIQSLVHDLKAPLTTIQGLSKLSEMITGESMLLEYQGRISRSADKMNDMISSILYQDKKGLISLEELFQRVFTSLNGQDNLPIDYQNECPDYMVRVNQVRMVRAIVNIVQNAQTAILGNPNGLINISVHNEDFGVRIRIRDNGKGIPQNSLSKIWEIGYSGNLSTGLGLGFVRSVMDNHGWEIEIESLEECYTDVIIYIKEVN